MPNEKAATNSEPLRLDPLDRELPPERAAEILEEYETESPTRKLAGWPARIVSVLAIALSSYALSWVIAIIPAQIYRPSFLAVSLVLAFLLYPFSVARTRRGWILDWVTAAIPVAALGIMFTQYVLARPQLDLLSAGPALLVPLAVVLAFAAALIVRPARDRLTLMDVTFAVAAVVTLAWPIATLEQFVQRAARPTITDLVLGTVMIFLVLEATRRSVGWILPATAVAFLLYGFWGPWLDLVGLSIIAHRGYELNRQIGTMYMTLEGIFGVPLDVAATYIILFTIYGAVLELSGAGKFFIDWALAAMGRSGSGAGPGRTVTVAGFLLGTVSGSGVATTVTLGSLAWPLLRRANYGPNTAGAMLAASGIGAILSPPTLGAAAFLIAEFLKISYLQVLIMATIPTLLYYLSIFLMIEADSRRAGARPVSIVAPALLPLTLRSGYHFTSLFAIAILMALGMTPFYAVFWAILLAIALSFLQRETALWPPRLLQALDIGGRGVVSVAATTAAAGIIVGIVTLTGLGLKTAGLIVTLAGGNLFFTVLFAAIAVWVLGLAVPVTASYIIAAVMIAPALIQVGVPDVAAHMFIFYYAVLSEVSPPTALAPFAAAALTGGNPFRTMMLTWKYTLPAFLVPFVFCLSPEGLGVLLQAPLRDVVWTTSTAAVGVVALALGFGGWLWGPAGLAERAVAVASGLLLFYASPATDAVGLALFALLLLWGWYRRRQAAARPATP
ncbi:MAG: C4-dicarboxylate ABC transporter permease [Dehalococcoidia bacterium]|nr:MAG: C4-dicarboxylate ABC transporter permease [Dehalococcoidia bacterium]